MTKLRGVSNPKVNYEAKHEAFSYQTQAFLALKDLDYCAIFHEQGLGKTKIAVDLLLYWLCKRGIDTVLIVTKKQLIQNWVEELTNHTHIRPAILTNDKARNYSVLNSPCKIIITNFETLSTEKKRMQLFLKTRDVAIVIDESTKLKNPDAQITRDYFELSQLFKIRCIMTGTPVANRPYDIWAQIYFLDKGKSLGTDFIEFRNHTDLSNRLSEDNQARDSFEKFTGTIFDKIKDFSVRETKKSASVQLPSKVYYQALCEFEPKQAAMYKRIISDLYIEIKRNGQAIIDDESEVLKRLLRLNEVASNPRILDENYTEESAKEKKLNELLSKIVLNGEKVIVWTNYIDNVDYYYRKFKQYNPRRIHGSMTIEERNNSVSKFKTDSECKVLFATPQAAKEGLTLTVANNVIFYDRGFNLDDYLQAQDRIHRISQTKQCNIYNIIVKDSIDEWIDKLLEAKQYAAFLAQGDINIEEYKENIDYSYGVMIRDILREEGGDEDGEY